MPRYFWSFCQNLPKSITEKRVFAKFAAVQQQTPFWRSSLVRNGFSLLNKMYFRHKNVVGHGRKYDGHKCFFFDQPSETQEFSTILCHQFWLESLISPSRIQSQTVGNIALPIAFFRQFWSESLIFPSNNYVTNILMWSEIIFENNIITFFQLRVIMWPVDR